MAPGGFLSPSRKVRTLLLYLSYQLMKGVQAKKAVNYAVDMDSGEEEDDDGGFNPTPGNKPRGRASKRRKMSIECDDDEDDVFIVDAVEEDDVVEEGALHQFV